jgi:hypothetical protein
MSAVALEFEVLRAWRDLWGLSAGGRKGAISDQLSGEQGHVASFQPLQEEEYALCFEKSEVS